MDDYRSMSDGQLVYHAKSGNPQAQDCIMDRYKNLVKKTARTFFIMGADFEDIVQEGMLGLFKAVRDYEPDRGAGFSSYANICITRQIMNALKSASRKKHAPLNDYVSLDEDNALRRISFLNLSEKSPEEILIIKEDQKKIIEGIYKTLSGFEAKALEFYLEGKSYAQIGKELEKNEKAVDNAIQRIRKKTKKIIVNLGIDHW